MENSLISGARSISSESEGSPQPSPTVGRGYEAVAWKQKLIFDGNWSSDGKKKEKKADMYIYDS